MGKEELINAFAGIMNRKLNLELNNAKTFLKSDLWELAEEKAAAVKDIDLPWTSEEFFKRVNEDDTFKGYYLNLQDENVDTEEIKWFWNLPWVEKYFIELTEENMKVAMFTNCLEMEEDIDKATGIVKKHFPIFVGDQKNEYEDSGINRPLPCEVWKWVLDSGLRVSKEASEKGVSLNSLIRNKRN